jgi:hypothetical protein
MISVDFGSNGGVILALRYLEVSDGQSAIASD